MKNTIIKQKSKEPSDSWGRERKNSKNIHIAPDVRMYITSLPMCSFRVHIVDRTRYLCILLVCMNNCTYVCMFVGREGVESRSVGRVSTKIKEHTHVLYVFVCVYVGALYVCVCGLLNLRTLRFCLLNNYFSLICAIFFHWNS